MAKKSMIERQKKRERLVAQYAAKRAALNEVINDQSKPMEERFKATLVFERAGEIEVEFVVEAMGSGSHQGH